MRDEFSICFCDINKQCTSLPFEDLNIQRYYNFATNKIILYDSNSVITPQIGDVFFGSNFMIITAYNNINLIEMEPYNWDDYIITILSGYLNIKNDRHIKIYANNNNEVIKHNSIDTIHKTLYDILIKLDNKYTTIELL